MDLSISAPLDTAPAGSGEWAPAPQQADRRRTRWLFFIPLIAFVGFGTASYIYLGTDVHLVPSPLIGKPIPRFSLRPVKGQTAGLSSADLAGHVSLVNVYASWCVACRAEHPLLMQLHKNGVVPLNGLDYKDPPNDAAKWLDTMGNPYDRTGADVNGRVAINWGVYGVPETFVIDSHGRIAYKQIGPITQEILDKTILPLIVRLRAGSVGHAH